MLRRLLTALFLLTASPVFGAIVSVGDTTANTCASASSSTTLVCTTNATVEVGNEHIIFTAADNITAGDGDGTDVSSATDSAGNTYTKLGEWRNGGSGAEFGVVVAVFKSRITTQLNSGGTFTFTYASAIDVKVGNGWEFTSGALLVEAAASVAEVVDSGTDFGELSFSGLSPAETLYFRMMGIESDTGTGLTETVGWTDMGNVRANDGGGSAAIVSRGEFLIQASSTGATSDPVQATGADKVSIMFALREQVAAATGGHLRRRN